MAKPGRNEPCPCGSGNKYKRCCLPKVKEKAAVDLLVSRAEADRSGSRPTRVAEALRESVGLDLHPYVIQRMSEDREALASLPRSARGRLERGWTISKVAALETRALVAHLASLDIRITADEFRELAADRRSAWSISDDWTPSRPLDPRGGDFLGLAACELWRRWCPDTPSMEMLDDWMQEGYVHDGANRGPDSAESWLRVWEALAPHLTPRMTRCDDVSTVFDGYQSIFNWCQDLTTTLRNLSVNDPEVWAPRGIAFVRSFLEQFSDERSVHGALNQDLAFMLWKAGQRSEAEEILRGFITERPHETAGYAALADLWTTGLEVPTPAYVRAIALLEQALDRPVVDGKEWDLERRLEHLRQQLEASVSGPPPVPG